MKKNIFNFIKLGTFILLTATIALFLGKIFIPDNMEDDFQGMANTINGYHNMPKNSIDVLFIGDSSLVRSISPMEMWNSDGIAAYNYSINSARIYSLYWMLKDALNYQSPKVVVIDPVTVFNPYKPPEAQVRVSVDYLENPFLKFETINDPIFENSFSDKASYIFPILRYHSRWNELKLEDFNKPFREYSSVTRGFLMSFKVRPNREGYSYMEKYTGKKKYENNSYEYLSKMIDMCNERNIKFLILAVEDAKVWTGEQSDLIAKFAATKNVDLLDLNRERYGLNWYEDTKDAGWHMNVLGAMKATRFVTNYLREHYELPDRRTDRNYDFWNEDYKIYKAELTKYMEEASKNVEKIRAKDSSSQN